MSSERRGRAARADDSLERARDFPLAVRAHPSAFVAPGAVVVGEVILGERSSVWFGAVLRGDMDAITLGDESNVQDNSVVHVDRGHPTVVGRRVVIGHRAIVHGAEVEDGCLVGMGSILLTGSHIGRGSLVAAGAVVGEGKKIPPRSLVVGVPGRVIGEVSEEMAAAISRGADHYVALSRSYRERGIASALPPVSGASVIESRLVPPDELEIDRLLDALEAGPAKLGQVLGSSGGSGAPAGAASRGDLLSEWLGEDERWRSGLDLLLERSFPDLPASSASAAADPGDGLQALADRLARHRLATTVRLRALPLTDWSRAGLAPEGGPVTVVEHVRRWAAREAALLRRLAALEPGARRRP